MTSPTTRQAYYALLVAIYEWKKQPTKARPVSAKVNKTRRMNKSKITRKVEAAQ